MKCIKDYIESNKQLKSRKLIIFFCIFFFLFFSSQGYEGSLLKVTSKNGKTASVSMINKIHLLFVALEFWTRDKGKKMKLLKIAALFIRRKRRTETSFGFLLYSLFLKKFGSLPTKEECNRFL